jgi:cytochrome c biogenesis protein CcmG, thiol:disulfide interchange protein DsbE
MQSAKKKKQRNRRSDLPQIVVGIGLVVLSFVFVLFVLAQNGKSQQQSADSGNRRYVVPVAVKFPAPELALENVQGWNESLSSLKGQVVLVNNWATWCPPCKAEMPTLAKYYNDHSSEGMMIVAVEAGEPKEQVQDFVDAFNLPFKIWLDPDGDALRAFNNENLPSSYVIDRSGMVRYAWTGEINREMLEKYITPLLNEQ